MSDDITKRVDVEKALNEWVGSSTANIFQLIDKIPSADRPRGEWIQVDDASISCRCSVCGWEAHLYEDDVYGMPYCPNCGAKMKGVDDEVL